MSFIQRTLAVLALSMGAERPFLQVKAGGIQSGPSSAGLYTGAMFFDQGDNTVYLTGIHYNNDFEGNTADKSFTGISPSTDTSSCFVASMRLSIDDDPTSNYDFGGIFDWRSNVNEVEQETCIALTLHRPSQIVVIGNKEITSPDKPPIEGSIAVFERNDLKSKKLSETTLIDQDEPMSQLVYPEAVVSDFKNKDYMYLVVLASKDAKDNSGVESLQKYPDWLRTQKYGSAFDMHVSKIKLSQGSGAAIQGIPTGSITFSKEWTSEFPLSRPEDRVFIGGIIHKKTLSDDGLIIVVGSTRGSGNGYGLSDGNDEDGFVTVIDPSNGETLGDGAREGSAEDDIVTGICDDPGDPEHFFIVGSTEGFMGGLQSDTDSVTVPTEMLQPFLRQVHTDRDSSDDDNLWTVQWAVTKESGTEPAYGSAIGCVVDDDYVYVAGTINDDAVLVQGRTITESQGGDDIWVAKINKNNHKVEWISQFGSDGDDRLARYGGIIINNGGDLMIYGDTNGSIYRLRDSSEDESNGDLFVMSLDKNTGTIMNNSNDSFAGGISNIVVNESDYEINDPTFFPTPFDTETLLPTEIPTSDTTEFPTEAFTDELEDNQNEQWGNYQDDDDSMHFYSPIGLQIEGPAYAGGIFYDSRANTVLVTGATFKDAKMENNPTNLCFMGIVDLDTGNLQQQIPRGSQDLEEACNAVTFDTNKNAVYAIGVAETDRQGRFPTSGAADLLGVSGGSDWEQADSNAASGGLIFQMDEKMQLLGGNRIVDYPAIYPSAVVTHPLDKDYLFVASVASENTFLHENYASGSNYPNFLDRENHKYGTELFLTIARYEVTDVPSAYNPNAEVPNTVDKSWFAEFRTDGGDDVILGGMVMAGNGNTLVVAGSTRGEGGPFDDNEGDSDMDGFIIKLNPNDGKVLDDDGKSSTRLDSVNRKDDYILNICNDRFDHDAVYVVGKSAGHIRDLSDAEQPPDGSTHAFVAKVNLETMRAEWLNHFTMSIPGNGVMHGEAVACSVTPDTNGQNIVYVGGTVKDGASMDSNSGSAPAHGKDDIFVASMNGGTGAMNWIQQIGTSENDRFGRSQALDVDSFGNVIVYAETTGSFYNDHKAGSDLPDLVIFTVNKRDGTYMTPTIDGQGVGSVEFFEGNVVENLPPVPRNGFPAVQTDDRAPSYAGGMHYDKFTNAIYLTGATYTEDFVKVSKSSQCLFGVMTLPKLQWIEKETLGTRKASEACSAIAMANYNGISEPIMVGSSEQSGLLDNLRTTRRSSQYGMILDMQGNGGSFDLIGGTVVDEDRVQFPVKVLADNDKVFLVSMASKSDQVQADSQKANKKKYPNYTTGGVEKYGSQYEILVERHSINREENLPPGSAVSTMSLDWRKPLETADKRSIFVSGMAMIDVGKALLVVGSTQGAEKDDDFDGIMAKISTDSGAFALDGDEARSVAYFSSVSGANDWILNVCPDVDDDRFFYVTGATGGVMDDSINKADSDVTVHAVVSKIHTETLNIVWTTQFGVTHASGVTDKEAASVALGCSSVPDKGLLYVAGDVENGAILEGATESAGGDDIFVAMLDTENGEKIWVKQVGSSGDDRIARGGGIVTDTDGNAVVFGDTNGSLYRIQDSSKTTDLFLMLFDQNDGYHENPMSKQAATKKNTSAKANPAPSEWFGTNHRKDPKVVGMIVGVVVSALVLMVSCAILYRRTRARHELAKQNAIFTYLQQFSVEDIDLRKSPPGGWHGTYLNKLAHGVNTAASLPEQPYRDEDDDAQVLFESAKMVHTSVKNSLFMDSGSAPTLGGYSDYNDAEDGILKPRKKNENTYSNPI
mmetsp:Transcript_8769/g.21413  ORF Transcript_8769/g.21413 Transcript_8769/m.21413 type:complete len:1810 (+) Transcript_8769:297-5726(+)|eukprot:CAMPEP_0197191590 /NCGR_PEP_ID=MMETSP1423-20130617/23652_1 /TAXON_ID=476441 /ORGANISM="Pseudo-nitzschia heimii, Strain UNC1101" /LENGTH=1809 /DNA_ID=CAMNT_0042644275 /DNA_START=165 /DNA_END=5594 /DNA_ORIENTATION=-